MSVKLKFIKWKSTMKWAILTEHYEKSAKSVTVQDWGSTATKI